MSTHERDYSQHQTGLKVRSCVYLRNMTSHTSDVHVAYVRTYVCKCILTSIYMYFRIAKYATYVHVRIVGFHAV